MVGRCSCHLGYVVGDDREPDHFDIVQQHFGLADKGADSLGSLLEYAARLKAAGL